MPKKEDNYNYNFIRINIKNKYKLGKFFEYLKKKFTILYFIHYISRLYFSLMQQFNWWKDETYIDGFKK